MTITFFIQWMGLLTRRNVPFRDFDLITISWSRNELSKDWGLDIALLGFGMHNYEIGRASCRERV